MALTIKDLREFIAGKRDDMEIVVQPDSHRDEYRPVKGIGSDVISVDAEARPYLIIRP